MCLAVPMEVLEIKGKLGNFLDPYRAVVEAGGTKTEVRLDIVDRPPNKGDYVIVHAGFAIHTLTKEEAQKSLELLDDMAQNA